MHFIRSYTLHLYVTLIQSYQTLLTNYIHLTYILIIFDLIWLYVLCFLRSYVVVALKFDNHDTSNYVNGHHMLLVAVSSLNTLHDHTFLMTAIHIHNNYLFILIILSLNLHSYNAANSSRSIVTIVAKHSGRTDKKRIVGNVLKHLDSLTSPYATIAIPYTLFQSLMVICHYVLHCILSTPTRRRWAHLSMHPSIPPCHHITMTPPFLQMISLKKIL